MSILRKTLVATALLGAGLGATTGAAFATGDDHHGTPEHKGMTMEHGGDGFNTAGVSKTCGNGIASGQQGEDQSGAANVSDVQTEAPLNACNNDIPVNVLGVQVPVQDASANAPVASPTGQDEDSTSSDATDATDDATGATDSVPTDGADEVPSALAGVL